VDECHSCDYTSANGLLNGPPFPPGNLRCLADTSLEVSRNVQRFNGTKLRELREQAGLTREHVAIAIGRSAETVGLYERGKVMPPASLVAAMADELGCPAGDLFTRVALEAA